MTSPSSPSGTIAGSVLPIRRAEELIATLQGVLSVRIVPSDTGAIDEIHVLTTDAVLPKQTVRNIESALMAQLGLRVNHRKVSIATTLDSARASDTPPAAVAASAAASAAAPAAAPAAASAPHIAQASHAPAVPPSVASSGPAVSSVTSASSYAERGESRATAVATPPRGVGRQVLGEAAAATRRALIFEDVEVRRSRSKGVLCRVTLGREGQDYIGEAEGQESERSRIELAARATLIAIVEAMKGASGAERLLALEGSKFIEAFDREFIFVSINARVGRETVVLTGSCEVRESPETSAVLAVLDATNRWMQLDR